MMKNYNIKKMSLKKQIILKKGLSKTTKKNKLVERMKEVKGNMEQKKS